MPEIIVKKNEGGVKIEKFLRKKLKNMPLSHIFKLLRLKKVRVNGVVVKTGAFIAEGDAIKLFMPEERFKEDIRKKPPISREEANRLPPPEIIYEDAHILVVNKPAGITVHGTSGGKEKDHILNRVQKYLKVIFEDSNFKPSLAHRLDKETSGVLLFGKTPEALRKLAEEIRSRRVEKVYIALVVKIPPAKEGKVIAPVIRRDKPSPEELKTSEGQPKTAISYYKVIETIGEYALLEMRPHTGRTHQLRSHARELGCPIAGDETYGDRMTNKFLKTKFKFNRFFLHAAHITFTHPITGKKMRIEAPMPEELRALLTALRKFK